MGTLRTIVVRLSFPSRMLLALIAAVALILPSHGSGLVPSALGAGTSTRMSIHAGDHAPAALAQHSASDEQAPCGAVDETVVSPCTDAACAVCAALAASPAARLTEPAPATWMAPIPMDRTGRQVAPDTPPPIA